MLHKEEIVLIVYFISIIFLLVLFVVVFFMAFQRRKNKFLIERNAAEQRYQKELANSQMEIQEQTFKYIAWELHDNVGQLLSVANMQLNVLKPKLPEVFQEQLNETKSLIQESVQEIRSLSKVLNNDVIVKNGLVESLKVELERYKRLGYLDTSLKIVGDTVALNSDSEIIIFRILQEFLSNVLKHAKASNLFVFLEFREEALEIAASDDGIGFDINSKSSGSGMETMKTRATLLNADFSIESEQGKGTQLSLKYFYSYGK